MQPSNTGTYKVRVHLYDLSQGMAKQFGRMLVGKDIEGIWHTGIEVYGWEYYFGGGICKDRPKKTPYGNPVREIDMGETELPEEIFNEFLQDINPKFTMEKYDLFSNNCNNFTDECSTFLTGQPIPDYITGLPKSVLATPLGNMIKPMIDKMQQQMQSGSHPMFQQQQQQQQQQSNNFPSFQQPSSNQQSQGDGDHVILEANDAFTFNAALTSNKAMIVDFFSFTCPPCMAIKPIYESLAKDWKNKCPEIKFVKVNTQIARDVAGKFGITSIPTFMGFVDGKQIERFSGASAGKVEKLLFQLESKVNESKQGGSGGIKEDSQAQKVMQSLNVSFNIFNALKKEPFLFAPDNFDVPLKKVSTTTEADARFSSSPVRKLFLEFAQNPKANLKNFSPENKDLLINWVLDSLITIGISDVTVAFIDMIRLFTNDTVFAEKVLSQSGSKIEVMINYILNKNAEELVQMPKGLRMILLRTLANFAAWGKSETIFNNPELKVFSKLLKTAKALKEDRSSEYAALMILYNLILLLEKQSTELGTIKKEVVDVMTDLLNGEGDEKCQLALLMNIMWLIYDNKALKALVNEKADKIKLLKMESSENENVRRATQDLIALMENKL